MGYLLNGILVTYKRSEALAHGRVETILLKCAKQTQQDTTDYVYDFITLLCLVWQTQRLVFGWD